MSDILKDLAAPFPPDVVSWRVGSTTQDKKKGMALAYIDARDVQDRLDQVCGINWQVRHPWSVGTKLACEIGIKVGDEWIWRGDGAGESDVEAEKGAFSDSFKRAAVRFGIGRYLYALDSPWVELKPAGKSYAIADHERDRLRKMLAGKAAAPQRPAALVPPKPVAPQPPKDVPLKYELLNDKEELAGAFATPDEWCRAFRKLLLAEHAPVPVLWRVNLGVAKSISDNSPALRWRVAGKEYHPYDVLQGIVEKLAPGIAA